MKQYKKILEKIAGNKMLKKVTLLLCVFCVALSFTGISWSFFKGAVSGGPGKQVTAKTANLSIVYDDGPAFTADEMFPGDSVQKTFTVTNNGDREALYYINWNTLTNNMGDKTDWTYVMTSTNGGGTLSETQIPNTGTHINIVDNIWIEAGVTQTYTITFKFKNEVSANQNDNRGKTISGKLEVIEQEIENLKLLRNQLIKNNPPVNNPTTTPGRQISQTDEGLIKGPVDDYGNNTYYFRGNVQDNYVSFAGRTWKVVRINGDGSLRLILLGTTGSAAWNTQVDSTYGNTYQPSNLNIAINWSTYSNSPLKTNVESWYNTNIGNNNSYDSKVSTGKFCNDKSYTGSSNPLYFGAYNRLNNTATASPQYTCPNSNDIYNLKVATITLDELAFAGGERGVVNSRYFLANTSAWTMSPFYWNTYLYASFVNSNGELASTGVEHSINVRPVINLKADVTATLDSQTNPGIISNPYRVS